MRCEITSPTRWRIPSRKPHTTIGLVCMTRMYASGKVRAKVTVREPACWATVAVVVRAFLPHSFAAARVPPEPLAACRTCLPAPRKGDLPASWLPMCFGRDRKRPAIARGREEAVGPLIPATTAIKAASTVFLRSTMPFLSAGRGVCSQDNSCHLPQAIHVSASCAWSRPLDAPDCTKTSTSRLTRVLQAPWVLENLTRE